MDNDGNYDWTETYISFDQIMLQLRKIASDGGQTVKGTSETLTIANGNSVNYTVVTIVISSIAIVTLLGAGLMIKRRKEDR